VSIPRVISGGIANNSAAGCHLELIIYLPYHSFVAVRKSSKNNTKGSQAAVIFWFVFAIVVICVFMVNAETIKTNFNLFISKLTADTEDELPAFEDEELFTVTEEQPAADTRPAAPVRETQPAQTSDPAVTVTTPAAQPPQNQQVQTPPQTQTTEPARTADRVVYFTQVSSDGQILQSRVTRRVPVSESPMLDSLNLLLTGPSAEELSRGILNLIPQNTRILSAAIRGTTAYISFSEDFLFNTFGVEGYVAQLRQIVWTVTEFQTVSDVQILIEGRRMDYLAEGIYIGSPIGRQSF